MTIRAVFFDIGETIIDETRIWQNWARRLGIPAHTFSAVFGAAIARGQDFYHVFRVLAPDFDLDEVKNRRGDGADFDAADLYVDVRECLTDLRAQGLFVGLAGNQRGFAGQALEQMGLDVDVIGTSAMWGVEKPATAFFQRLAVVEARCPASQVLYVGDRLDFDAKPAQRAGLKTALIRRGPWGYILDNPAILDHCLFKLDTLAELPGLVRAHNERTLA